MANNMLSVAVNNTAKKEKIEEIDLRERVLKTMIRQVRKKILKDNYQEPKNKK